MIRAVVDVNVLISAIIGPLGHSRQVALAWEAARFSAISSAGIIGKLEEKLSLPQITRRYSIDTPAVVGWLRLLLSNQAEFIRVPLQDRPAVTGDPEDDYVLATGRLAQADYLVTGDKGLLRMRQYRGIQIVSPRQFLELLQKQEGG